MSGFFGVRGSGRGFGEATDVVTESRCRMGLEVEGVDVCLGVRVLGARLERVPPTARPFRRPVSCARRRSAPTLPVRLSWGPGTPVKTTGPPARTSGLHPRTGSYDSGVLPQTS